MKIIGILLPSDPRIWWEWGVKKVATEIWKTLIKSNKYKVSYIFIDKKNHSETQNWINYIWIRAWWHFPFDLLLFWHKIKKIQADVIIDNMWIANLYNNIDKKVKIIQICHGVAGEWLKSINESNFFMKIKYFIYYFLIHIVWKFTYRKANKIVALSKNWKEWIIKYYWVEEKKIQIINNWTDTPENNETKKSYKRLTVLFISWDHRRKRIDIIEKIANDIKDQNIQFKIIWAPYISTSPSIEYLWKLPREKTYKTMQESDIIFLPSDFEWQPLVVLEAMGFWCIPLVSENCNLDMIEGTELEQFVWKNNDYKYYEEKIKYLAENNDVLKKYMKISQDIIQKYTWENQTKKYLDIIDELI